MRRAVVAALVLTFGVETLATLWVPTYVLDPASTERLEVCVQGTMAYETQKVQAYRRSSFAFEWIGSVRDEWGRDWRGRSPDGTVCVTAEERVAQNPWGTNYFGPEQPMRFRDLPIRWVPRGATLTAIPLLGGLLAFALHLREQRRPAI